MLLLAADAHHDRRSGLLGKHRGRIAEIALVILLPKPPPVYSLMTTTSLGSMFSRAPGKEASERALRGAMDVDLSVLPIRHGGARFQRLMAGVGRHEGLVQNQIRALETRLPVAVGPFGIGGLAHGQLAVFVLGEIRFGPFDFLDAGAAARARERWPAA